MSEEMLDPQRDRLLFFSQVVRTATHELSNIFSIAEQVSGLLEDAFVEMDRGVQLRTDRLKQVPERLLRQTGRGTDIVSRLNRLAHSLDFPESDFDVCVEVENILSLMRRLADMKEVDLRFKGCGGTCEVHGDSFRLQQWVFVAVEALMAISPKGGVVEVEVIIDEQDIRIRANSEQGSSEELGDEPRRLLQQFAEILEGRFDLSREDRSLRVELSVSSK